MPLVWIAAENGKVPDRAIAGGRDSSGDTYFVGRAQLEGMLVPGKVHPSQGCLYVPYNGKEVKETRYEVLVNSGGTNVAWIPSSGGNIPRGAVQGGMQNGEPLYIGRHVYDKATVIGKVQVSQKALYVAYGGKEVKFDDYDVLVEPLQWIQSSNGNVPPNAVSAGADPQSHETYFVGRAKHNNALVPGKVQPSQKCLYIPFDGKEVKYTDYEVLTNPFGQNSGQSAANNFSNTTTTTTTTNNNNANNSFSNKTATTTQSFSNTNTNNNNNSFSNASSSSSSGGNNNFSNNSAAGTNNAAGGGSVTLEWLRDSNGSVPPDAVSAGMQDNSEEVFVGRAMVQGSPVVGKVHPKNKCLYVPYNGSEQKFDQYEVLVCQSRRFDMTFTNR